MVGDSVTATRASHWRDVSRACPHCGHEEETVEHQLWHCPRWASVRQAAAARFGLGPVALVATQGPLTLHALLRPPCPHRCAAGRQPFPGPLPPEGPLASAAACWETAWTDGAGTAPASCGLARATWAVHFGAGGRASAGPVPGAQSVQRAELFAAVQAVAFARGPVCVVTDSQYVARGVERLLGWPRPPEWVRSDLWARLWRAAHAGVLVARWVPAHRGRPDPPLLSEADWRGNAEADRRAGDALRAAQPPPHHVAAALDAELHYAAAVAVGSAALEAQLAWAHAGIADGPTRFPRHRVRFQSRPRPRTHLAGPGEEASAPPAGGEAHPPGRA